MDMASVYGLVFTLLFNVGPLFQILNIVRSGCSANNSYGLWICGLLGQLCVLCYYVEMGTNGMFNYINSVMGLLLCIVMIMIIWVYRKK